VSQDDSLLTFPPTDPTPIFELFRGSYATELLVAASSHFNVFSRLAKVSMSEAMLGQELGLERRPAIVLLTALKAMELLRENQAGELELTDLSRNHLLPRGDFFMGDYLGLSSSSEGVL